MRFCFCGGNYGGRGGGGNGAECSRPDCRRLIGGGSWHRSPPHLQDLYSISEDIFASRWPDFGLAKLEAHVKLMGDKRNSERRESHANRVLRPNPLPRRTSLFHQRSHHCQAKSLPRSAPKQLVPQSKRLPRAARRQPALPSGASSSSGPLLPLQQVRIEPEADLDDLEADASGAGPASDVTPDSDSSGSSLFSLRNKVHDMTDADELSEVSSQASDEAATAVRERVWQWRTESMMEADEDFAYAFVNFEEAHAAANMRT